MFAAQPGVCEGLSSVTPVADHMEGRSMSAFTICHKPICVSESMAELSAESTRRERSSFRGISAEYCGMIVGNLCGMRRKLEAL